MNLSTQSSNQFTTMSATGNGTESSPANPSSISVIARALSLFQLAGFLLVAIWSLGFFFMIYREIRKFRANRAQLGTPTDRIV